MECSICSTLPLILRPPRNTICAGCYEAARSAISLVNKLETCDKGSPASPSPSATDHRSGYNKPSSSITSLPASSPSSSFCKPQPLANLPRWINTMNSTHDELTHKIDFLSNFVDLFRSHLLADIHLKPGHGGAPIPAHRALLAARSEIFKTMLDPEACKSPANDTITLPELNGEELESLLEFLYSGSLAPEKLERHVYALTMAADKYEIPYLLGLCQRHMAQSLDTSNALEVLEISDSVCCGGGLKERAVKYAVENMEELAFSGKYEGFVAGNPRLAVQVVKAFLVDANKSAKHGQKRQ